MKDSINDSIGRLSTGAKEWRPNHSVTSSSIIAKDDNNIISTSANITLSPSPSLLSDPSISVAATSNNSSNLSSLTNIKSEHTLPPPFVPSVGWNMIHHPKQQQEHKSHEQKQPLPQAYSENKSTRSNSNPILVPLSNPILTKTAITNPASSPSTTSILINLNNTSSLISSKKKQITTTQTTTTAFLNPLKKSWKPSIPMEVNESLQQRNYNSILVPLTNPVVTKKVPTTTIKTTPILAALSNPASVLTNDSNLNNTNTAEASNRLKTVKDKKPTLNPMNKSWKPLQLLQPPNVANNPKPNTNMNHNNSNDYNGSIIESKDVIHNHPNNDITTSRVDEGMTLASSTMNEGIEGETHPHSSHHPHSYRSNDNYDINNSNNSNNNNTANKYNYYLTSSSNATSVPVGSTPPPLSSHTVQSNIYNIQNTATANNNNSMNSMRQYAPRNNSQHPYSQFDNPRSRSQQQQQSQQQHQPPRSLHSLSIPQYTMWNTYRNLNLVQTKEMEPNDDRYKAIPPGYNNAMPLLGYGIHYNNGNSIGTNNGTSDINSGVGTNGTGGSVSRNRDPNNNNTSTSTITSTSSTKRSSFGYPSSAFRVTNVNDGHVYCLRRYDSVRCVNQRIADIVTNAWTHAILSNDHDTSTTSTSTSPKYLLEHSGLVKFYSCFYSSRSRALFFIHDYYSCALTLQEYLFQNFNHPNQNNSQGGGGRGRRGRYFVPLPEKMIWGYLSQLAAAVRAVHSCDLACRTLDLGHILCTPEPGSGITNTCCYDENDPQGHDHHNGVGKNMSYGGEETEMDMGMGIGMGMGMENEYTSMHNHHHHHHHHHNTSNTTADTYSTVHTTKTTKPTNTDVRTRRYRLRINCLCVPDALEFESRKRLHELQKNDIRDLGLIVLSLALGFEVQRDINDDVLDSLLCQTFLNSPNNGSADDTSNFSSPYGPALCDLIGAMVLSSKTNSNNEEKRTTYKFYQGFKYQFHQQHSSHSNNSNNKKTNSPTIYDVCRAAANGTMDELDAMHSTVDVMHASLMAEYESGRALRLLLKLGFINERPEFGMDERWSETGDRYILKLFRDYGALRFECVYVCKDIYRICIDNKDCLKFMVYFLVLLSCMFF